jgi:hypothetical protein
MAPFPADEVCEALATLHDEGGLVQTLSPADDPDLHGSRPAGRPLLPESGTDAYGAGCLGRASP